MTLPICEQLQKSHPELVVCESNEKLLQEHLTNFSDGDTEAAFQHLASDGSLALKATEQMLAEQRYEAELERSKAERARRMAYNDDIRKLKGMSREDLEFELKRRRKAEAAGQREANPLLQKSVDELKAIIQEQEASKNRRPGIEPLPLKIRLRYQPSVEVVLDARGIKSLDSDELRYLGQRYGFDQVNERIAATSGLGEAL